MPREQYVLRLAEGPNPGTAIVSVEQFGWPAPGIIKGSHPGGYYEKVSEDTQPSRLPDGDPIFVARYIWRKEGKVG